MLMTVLATIGVAFIIGLAYKKGRKDGMREAIHFMMEEANRDLIEIQPVEAPQIEGKTSKNIETMTSKISHLIRRKK